MRTRVLSEKLVLLVIGLAAGSGILIPASYGSFHPVNSSEIQDGTIQTVDLANNAITSAKLKDGDVNTAEIGGGAVTSAKLGNGAVNSAKIADDSIAAADIGPSSVGESEIAPNAVGASELQGVTKLMFIDCVKTIELSISPGNVVTTPCTVPGADVDDLAIASHSGSACFPVAKVDSQAGYVSIHLFNRCTAELEPGALNISLIVYDT